MREGTLKMARKVNTIINNNSYFRVTAEIGKTSDGKRIRKQFYGKSQKEAEQKRNVYLEKINKGLSVNFDKVSLGEYMNEWLFTVERHKLKLSSFNRYESLFRVHIKNSDLFRVPITSIKSIHIQKYYNHLIEIGKKPTTIEAINKLIKKFFNYCIKEDILVKNPCQNVNLPRDFSVKEHGIDVFTNDEISIIQDKVCKARKYFIFLFALMTGLRQGELLALTISDIDTDNNTIVINKSAKHVIEIDNNGNRYYKREVQTPKSVASNRIVPFPASLNPSLIQHIEEEKIKHNRLNLHYDTNILLFTNEIGRPLDESNLRKTWRRFLTQLNIKYRKFHILRHTYCTLLAKNGVSLKTASELMGHDINMTARIYTHISEAEKKSAAESIGHLL